MLEAISGLFMLIGLGTVTGFLVLAAILTVGVANYKEDVFTASVGIAALLGILLYANGTEPFIYVYHHPFTVILWVGLYFLAGTIWAVWRWLGLGGFAWKARRRFDEQYTAFLKNRGWTSIPDGQLEEWRAYRDFKNLYPLASENKALIVTWIITWVIDFFVWAFGDFVVEMAKFIYRRISKGLDAFTRRYVYRGIDPKLLD